MNSQQIINSVTELCSQEIELLKYETIKEALQNQESLIHIGCNNPYELKKALTQIEEKIKAIQ